MAAARTQDTPPANQKKKAKKKKKKSLVRPLMARPGAHYTCFGDGLCCTDLHGLGPLTKKEVRALSVISDDVVIGPGDSGFDEPMLRTRHDGGCLFLSAYRCELHAALGAEAKPDGCRRFPLGLTATPRGGRITTRHRCPCRSLGDRPPVSPESATPSLVDGAGRLTADRRIGLKVRVGESRRISFEQWEALEQDLMEQLEAGDDPIEALGVDPFPALDGSTWKKVADDMVRRGADHTRFGTAIEWFARSIKALTDNREPRTVRPLSWAAAFDRAEARSPNPRTADEVLRDWLADEIWGMQWTELGSFDRARADLATRYAIANDIATRLETTGTRPDRAAAEAVAIVDLMGDSEWWDDVVVMMEIE